MDDPANITIRPARLDEIFELRWQTLRPGLPRETANIPGDEDATTRHFAALSAANELIACTTFLRSDLDNQPAWRLRGMAVRSDHQNRGLGSRLLQFAE